MNKILLVVLLGSGFVASACSPRMGPRASESPSTSAETTPALLDTSAEPSDVIRRYYEAINSGDYHTAYALWGDDGPPNGQTFEVFQAGFRETAQVNVEVGEPGRIEGAAGSRYVEIPVVVRARTKAGAAQRFEGTYTLRRVVVEGATPAQQRWHFYQADLRQVQ